MTQLGTNSPSTTAAREDRLLRTLSSLAHEANDLAKHLRNGSPLQRKAYRLKNRLCSALLILGGAVVNGRQTDPSLLALDIMYPASQIHCRQSELEPEAQAITREQAACAPVKGSMSDRLRTDQLEQIASLFPSKRRAA